MKKLLFILVLLYSVLTYGQRLKSLIVTENTTFLYEKDMYFIGDTLYLNNFKVRLQSKAYVRFEVIVGPGEIYLYPESTFMVKKKLEENVKVYITEHERKFEIPKRG